MTWRPLILAAFRPKGHLRGHFFVIIVLIAPVKEIWQF
jgi:hypothetical protein